LLTSRWRGSLRSSLHLRSAPYFLRRTRSRRESARGGERRCVGEGQRAQKLPPLQVRSQSGVVERPLSRPPDCFTAADGWTQAICLRADGGCNQQSYVGLSSDVRKRLADHNAPTLSAVARNGARADVANGNFGTAPLMGPNSQMGRLTMPSRSPSEQVCEHCEPGCFALQHLAMHTARGGLGHDFWSAHSTRRTGRTRRRHHVAIAMRHAPPSRSRMIVVHIRRTLPQVVIS
jgi:hypothetical protein